MKNENIIYGIILFVLVLVTILVINKIRYKKLEAEILASLGFRDWDTAPYIDTYVSVKSRQAIEKYDDVKFFKENKDKFTEAEKRLVLKNNIAKIIKDFLADNEFEKRYPYKKVKRNIDAVLINVSAYRVQVDYISSAGNHLAQKELHINQRTLDKFNNDPSILMGKAEYNKFLKETEKKELDKKHHLFYEKVNKIVDFASNNKPSLILKEKQDMLDSLISQLFDRTVNSIQKIKTIDSEEWGIIDKYISNIDKEINEIVSENQKILDYYESSGFQKIKATCEALMSSQKEFNEYINEKVHAISTLFGTKVIRNETVTEDEHNYIRPYKKTITPFTAEVSAAVFASAENNPIEYIVKNFYPNKSMYPEQIQKLQLLIEELETLREAKQIIENYKKDYKQYIQDVPAFIMEKDETGFYSRLGFAYIDESVLTVEYKFHIHLVVGLHKDHLLSQ
ncbi:MAG: hypothetical protein IKP88_15185 [Lachnospiraceae bacterium]|nr:hypothetical protein [Lachnospiraceae bacterium]